MNKTVVLTGATGYIGSHMFAELLGNGFNVVGVDDLSNSSIAVLPRIGQVCGVRPTFEKLDIRNTDSLIELLNRTRPDSVLHFAGVKSVKESVLNPHKYYDTNVGGTLSLLHAMRHCRVNKLVFSSSCTVYGQPSAIPVDEHSPLKPLNAYGYSKLFAEQMITDVADAHPEFCAISLRYFNPIGAHPSGLIGEAPSKTPDNLLPYIVEVAAGKRPSLSVFGDDYPTDDGTCVRDYIHVMDLVSGHLHALRRLDSLQGTETINLGTGRGYSVLQVVNTFKEANGVDIPHGIKARRPGDAASMFANPAKAESLLKWKAQRSLREMCVDHWRWGQNMLATDDFDYS